LKEPLKKVIPIFVNFCKSFAFSAQVGVIPSCAESASPSRNVRLTANPDALILHKIMSSSTYTISQAQAKLPRLIKEDSFAISVHGEVKGFYLSKHRLEAMIESIELLENPEFTAALKAHRSGRAKTYTVKELDEKFSA
jgi:PHD/YefM family antitoxin component YafN of YafNO toxin-antitoxin module